MTYCNNHDVATGKYDCPYADVVNNSICCNCNECNYRGITSNQVANNTKEEMFKLHSGSVYGNNVYRIILGEDIRYLSDEEFPF